MKKEEVSEETVKRVTEYVNNNYKYFKDKVFTIKESDNCFYVYDHKNGSPLILGKGII